MPDQVLELVKRWLADPSDHDAEVWPALRQAIEANRLADRERFKDCQDA